MVENVDRVVVIGAGPGGLAAAAELQRCGFAVTVLERGNAVAGQWRRQYDRLSLNTVRWSAHLPRRRLPRAAGRWPSRDDLVAYLERYAAANGLRIAFGAEVERVERGAGGWRLLTRAGPIDASLVVIATGSCNEPSIPDWAGAAGFEGELLHAVDYGNATRFRDRDVLVVGAGNSGAEIATDLAENGARTVWLSVRTPPNLLPRWSFIVPPELFSKLAAGLPEGLVDGGLAALRRVLVGDLAPYGLPRPPRGFYATLRHSRVTPIVDVGLVRALKAGEVTVVPAVESIAGGEVILAAGGRLRPDAVIAATGYRRCLEPLVGHLGVLDERGMPRAHAAADLDQAPGLHFIGFAHPSGSSLRELRIDARRLGRAARRRAHPPSA
jgi:putative flavoprotein involved in K+ transport